jgi:drug/metabolite transporter (DMT)-like permease
MPPSRSTPDGVRNLLAFASCTLIWGSTFLVIRIGNDTVPPQWAAALRLALAAVVMLLLVVLTGRRLPAGAARQAAVLYGVFQFGVNVPLLYWGEMYVSSGLTAVMYATIPINNALIARAFGLERLHGLKMTAAVIAVAGVAVMFAPDLTAGATALPLLGIYLATVAASFGSTMLKRGPRQDPLAANAVGAACGVPFCLLASWLLHETHRLPTTWLQIYPIVYLAIVGSVVAFVAFAWLVNRWPISTVGFIGVVVPIIAVTLGAIVRHERLLARHVLGGVLVLAGVSVAIVSDRQGAASRARAAA